MATANTTRFSKNGNANSQPDWASKYGQKHRLQRVIELPGVDLPKKVRIYARNGQFLLQWWDPSWKKTLSQRVDGDLLSAIVQAREIESRLQNYSRSGYVAGRVSHERLVDEYLADLTKRADAGEIDPRTVLRYEAPLRRHFLEFVGQLQVRRKYPYVTNIDRQFYLEFSAYLQNRRVSPNGSTGAATRPMRGQRYILDVTRSMLHWAADENRGNLLPPGFRNPFHDSKRQAGKEGNRGVSEPDITVAMAAELLSVCDDFQLPIFATLAMYGLRPDELGWIFREDIEGDWVRVICHLDLDYRTKGRRDKQFPVVEPLRQIWAGVGGHEGLLFRRKTFRSSNNPLISKRAIVEEYRRRQLDDRQFSAARRRQLRDKVLSEAGQLTYDHVEGEFGKLAKQLNWPKSATLKDFRHLFATSLENAGVPESYRRFLMGHSAGRAAIVTYTHLNKVREYYSRAVSSEFETILRVLQARTSGAN